MTELYKAVLEDAGYKVNTKNFTTRDIYIKALSSGDVQIAADYLSSMTEELNRRANGKDADPVASPDADATVAKLDELGKPRRPRGARPGQGRGRQRLRGHQEGERREGRHQAQRPDQAGLRRSRSPPRPTAPTVPSARSGSRASTA